MPERRKRKREAPPPATAAGLLMFFEDEAHGIQIDPVYIIIATIILVVVSLLIRYFIPIG